MSLSKPIILACLGLAGSVVAADLAQAQVQANGAGSSAGRQYAGLTPAYICDAGTNPIYYQSLENPANRTEWHCPVGGGAHIFRYSASNSADGYTMQPNGATVNANYLTLTATGFAACSTPVPTANFKNTGRTVNVSTCGTLDSDPVTPGNQTVVNPNTARVVHWGASDVQPTSFSATAFGTSIAPPPAGHLTATPIVAVPFSIVVGGNVRNGAGTANATNISTEKLKEILTGRAALNGLTWVDLGFNTTTANKVITMCQRTVPSGTLATLNQTVLDHPRQAGIDGTATATNIANASSSNVKACVENNPNSIGYIDSDTVPNLLNGAYQIALDGYYPSNPAYGAGIARTKDLRCGNYKYWADWVIVTRNIGVEVPPVSAIAGTNAAVTAFQNAALANNPLPDYWGAQGDMFVFKLQDNGNHNFFTPNGNGVAASTVCQ